MILEVFLIDDNKTLISKTIRLILGIKSSQLKKLFSCQDSFDQRKSPWEKNCQGPCKEVEVEHHRFISGQRRENRDEVCVFRPLNQPRRTEDGGRTSPGMTFASFYLVAAAAAMVALASGLSDLRLCADQECQGEWGSSYTADGQISSIIVNSDDLNWHIWVV